MAPPPESERGVDRVPASSCWFSCRWRGRVRSTGVPTQLFVAMAVAVVASLAVVRDGRGQEQDPKPAPKQDPQQDPQHDPKQDPKQDPKPEPKQDPERLRPVAVVPVADDEVARKFKAEFEKVKLPWEPATLAANEILDAPAVIAGRLLADDEIVIGATVGKESRAYPIRTLATDEVVNDVLGGQPIVVTWCVVCQSAIVYDRTVGGRTLTFGNYRAIWRGSMVMYDVETASLWVQASGAASAGALHGQSLAPRIVSTTTWRQWRDERPATTVALGDSKSGERRAKNRVFDPKAAEQLGVVVRAGDAVTLFPLAEVARRRAVVDRVGELPVVVVYSEELDLLQVFRRDVAGTTIELAIAARGARPATAADPPQLEEVGGPRRWRADNGQPLPADAAWPALERVVAYPMRIDLFNGHFPKGRIAAPSGR
jgi:hypothetical protein